MRLAPTDEPVDASAGEQAEVRLLLAGILVAVPDDEHVPARLGHVLDAAHHGREEGVGDVGDDQPEGVRAL
jgi:hypothetical protein